MIRFTAYAAAALLVGALAGVGVAYVLLITTDEPLGF